MCVGGIGLTQASVAPVSYWISCATGLPVRTKLERLVTGDRSNKLMSDGKRPRCDGMKCKLFEREPKGRNIALGGDVLALGVFSVSESKLVGFDSLRRLARMGILFEKLLGSTWSNT